jgi:Tannase and feruloyl esterase
MVYDNPAWDFRTVSAESAVNMADKKIGRTLNAADPDLRPFKAHGGKLILYHGWSDAAVPGLSTINYYDSVAASMGVHETEDFVRLYMAPGVQHCFGGPGPNFFGQLDASSFGGPQEDSTRQARTRSTISSMPSPARFSSMDGLRTSLSVL